MCPALAGGFLTTAPRGKSTTTLNRVFSVGFMDKVTTGEKLKVKELAGRYLGEKHSRLSNHSEDRC